MPKGADLHSHLSGAVYAETHIRDAIADGLCVDQDAKAFAKSQPVIAGAELEPVCEQDQVPATELPKNQPLYNSLVDSFSMRGFVPSAGVTGHDHFFDAFTKFGGTDPRHTGEWVDEVAARAASQNIQYLELMVTPTWRRLNTITKGMTWSEDLKSLKGELMAKGLLDDIPAARAFLDEADARRRDRGIVGRRMRVRPARSKHATSIKSSAIRRRRACSPRRCLALSWHPSIRAWSGSILSAAKTITQPWPTTPTTCEFSNLCAGFIPTFTSACMPASWRLGSFRPEGLCCHVRQAVEVAGTDRIGHGVDVMYEEDPESLLKDMAAKQVLVEINLTSNEDVLGVSGKSHPFPIYRKFGVPVALSTDDEGIERIDLTNEYVRAVESYDLSYADLKQLVRNSLEYSFLPGASLWAGPDFARLADACGGDAAGADKPSSACETFLKGSEKAEQQWELERRFQVFEAGF